MTHAAWVQGQHSWVLHVGQFSEGKRNGLGVVVSSKGERLDGYFNDDLAWGPGIYRWAQPTTGSSSGSDDQAPPSRVHYQGMLNGRPMGRGCVAWSDDRQEMGQVGVAPSRERGGQTP